MRVDVHAHCYPKPYVEELEKIGIGKKGGIGIEIPVWESTGERIAQMDNLGVHVEVLALSAPNVRFIELTYANMLLDFQKMQFRPDQFVRNDD